MPARAIEAWPIKAWPRRLRQAATACGSTREPTLTACLFKPDEAIKTSATMQNRIISSAPMPKLAFGRALQAIPELDGDGVWSREHDGLRFEKPPIRGAPKNPAPHRSRRCDANLR